MKTFRMNKRLPWAPADIYRLLLDVGTFPAVHPEVKAARTAWVRPGYRDIEIDFNKAAGVILQGQALALRVTATPAQKIEAVRTKGQIEHLKMSWALNPDVDGGTDMEFALAYQTGQGDVVDNIAFPLVKKLVGDTLSRFEGYATARAAQGTLSLDPAEGSPAPSAKKNGGRKSGYQP